MGAGGAAVGGGRAPVSVVIPCFCCGTTIGRALASVAAQTVLPFEVVLVEDASPDGGRTLDELHSLAARYGNIFQLKIIQLKENGGAGSARNRAWEAASQPYIAFLDADDAWHPQKIEYQFGWMAQHPAYGLVGHAHMRCDAGRHAWPELLPGSWFFPVSKTRALLSNPFATPTVMLKRDLPFRFKEGKRHAEDYLLWLQVVHSGEGVACINQSLTASFKKDYGDGGLSADLWRMEMGELDTYWQVCREKRGGFIQFPVLLLYSFTKYLRRVGRTYMWRGR